MLLHGGDHRCRRHLQKCGVETTGQRHGPLNEAGYFLKEVVLDHGSSTESLSDLADLLFYNGFALIKVSDHKGRAQGLLVAMRIGDDNGFSVMESVSAAAVVAI